jgi:hypothetical protein
MGGVKAPVDNYTAEDDRCVERHETSTWLSTSLEVLLVTLTLSTQVF